MALTKEDLQAIASLIQQSEERTTRSIQETKNEIMSYIESHVVKELHQID